MGFAASSTLTQGVAETAVRRAGLPLDKQLSRDKPPPTSYPVWGVISDDFWILDVDEEDSCEPSVGSWWAELVEKEWIRIGIENLSLIHI